MTIVEPLTNNPVEHQFYPYTNNGGTVLGIAGDDYCVMAADTRQSEGYSINSRYVPKVWKLNETTVLANAGFSADGFQLMKNVKTRIELYRHQHHQDISCPAVAQMLSIMLYGKRFFPYYSNNLIGGLDEDGKGALYSFDSVGSYGREWCRAGGSAASLIQPFLDNQIDFKNLSYPKENLPLEKVVKILKDIFTSATERDILTGDGLIIMIITKDGVKEEFYPLKRD